MGILLNTEPKIEIHADLSFLVYEEISKDIDSSWCIEVSKDINSSWQVVIIPVSKNIDLSFIVYSQVSLDINSSWNGYSFLDSRIDNATGYEFNSRKRIREFIGE